MRRKIKRTKLYGGKMQAKHANPVERPKPTEAPKKLIGEEEEELNRPTPTPKEKEKEKTHEQILYDVYYDPKTGYGNAKALFDKVKKEGIKMKEVQAFLKKQEVFQVLKQKKRVKKYFPITAGGEGSFQADLTFFDKFSTKNKVGTKNAIGALTCINIHTRKAYAQPIFGKQMSDDSHETEGTVLNGMKIIVGQIKKNKGEFNNLTTDSGSEFVSKEFQKYIEGEGVSGCTLQTGETRTRWERLNASTEH